MERKTYGFPTSLACLTLLAIIVVGTSVFAEADTSPLNSNVYYLQDYCEELVEAPAETSVNVRERRDVDHDHDHDHDHFHFDRWTHGHDIQNYYMNKTAKLVKSEIKFQKKMLKKQLKLEQKLNKKRRKFVRKLQKKIKQIHLDPILQPSIVIRSWREQTVATIAERLRRRQEMAKNKTMRKVRRRMKRICQILLKLPANVPSVELKPQKESAGTGKNGEKLHRVPLTHFGTVVNFLELNKSKPEESATATEATTTESSVKSRRNRVNHNIRIITSDPTMTQYWFQGERLKLDNDGGAAAGAAKPEAEAKASEPMPESSNQTESIKTNIDIIDEGAMLEPILKQLSENDNDTKSTEETSSTSTAKPSSETSPNQTEETEAIKWLLIQLDTSDIDDDQDENNTTSDLELSDVEEDYEDDLEDDYDDFDDLEAEQQQIELIINLYQAMKQLYGNETAPAPSGSEPVGTKTVGTQSESDSNEGQNPVAKPKATCPMGTFDCANDGTQCIPSSLRCNGEDNCGNRADELQNCGSINLYYIFGGSTVGPSQSRNKFIDYIDENSEGIWFGLQILLILFLAASIMYYLSLCCRLCDRKRRTSGKHGYNQLTEHPQHRSIYVNKSGQRMFANSSATAQNPSETQWLSSSWSRQFRPSVPDQTQQPLNPNYHLNTPPPPYNSRGAFLGNQSDNQRSVVNEHIYVNNNYGQPLGSTTVATNVQPQVGAPPLGGDQTQYSNCQDYPPMYPNMMDHQQHQQQQQQQGPRNYGGINEKC